MNYGRLKARTRKAAIWSWVTGVEGQVDVIALVEGTPLDVRCSVPGCGCARTWWTGENALERLIERRRS